MTFPVSQIPVSTVPAVKTYLFDLLTANLSGDGTDSFSVQYALPMQQQLTNDLIYLGDVTRQVPAGLMVGNGGLGARQEAYTINVEISCYRGGDNAQAVIAQAWALASAVESQVRSDPKFGGLLTTGGWPQSSTEQSLWSDNNTGRVCNITVAIYCETFI